jgi:cell division protein FtsZ
MKQAELGVEELKQVVDSLILIPNDRLSGLAGKKMGILDAFKPADDVLRQAVQGISDLITNHGMINVDFADVKAGDERARHGDDGDRHRRRREPRRRCRPPGDLQPAARRYRHHRCQGRAGQRRRLVEHDHGRLPGSLTDHPREGQHEDANIFIGLVIDESLGDRIKVTAIATGFGDAFDKRRQAAKEPARPALAAIAGNAPASQGDMDVPAYIRNRDGGAKPRPARAGLGESEEYDIPAFLRRRVD